MMENNKLISIDFDATLLNCIPDWIEWMNNALGLAIPITIDQIVTYDWMWNNYGELSSYFWKDRDSYTKSKLFPDTLNFLDELKGMGYMIQIVTKSYPGTEKWKTEFINNITKGKVWQILHAHEKYKVTKGTVLIDDFIDNIIGHCFHNCNRGVIFDYNLQHKWNNKYKDNEHYLKYHGIKYKSSYEDILRDL